MIKKTTDTNIKAVCRVMCECDFLSPDQIAHYAKIAEFKPDVDKAGNEYYKFQQKYGKSSYIKALAKALYSEMPKGELERAKVIEDFDFFLNSFGELSHTAVQYWNGSTNVLNSLIQSIKPLPGGAKGTGESI
jgi:hypothetical protein